MRVGVLTGRVAAAERERGAALVEFALIFPLFMTLVLGMFSGGLAYNQDLSLTHAAREGSRYGATLVKAPAGLNAAAWTKAVRDRVIQAATEELDITRAGHYVCVALVEGPAGTVAASDSTGTYFEVVGTPPTAPPGNCYTDGLSDPFARVHVVVGRPGKIEALFFSTSLKLTSRGTARYEP